MINSSIILACVWVLCVSVFGALQTQTGRRTGAYVAIFTGLPLLVYLSYQTGPLAGMVGLIAFVSILRWPLLFIARKVMRKLGVDNDPV